MLGLWTIYFSLFIFHIIFQPNMTQLFTIIHFVHLQVMCIKMCFLPKTIYCTTNKTTKFNKKSAITGAGILVKCTTKNYYAPSWYWPSPTVQRSFEAVRPTGSPNYINPLIFVGGQNSKSHFCRRKEMSNVTRRL